MSPQLFKVHVEASDPSADNEDKVVNYNLVCKDMPHITDKWVRVEGRHINFNTMTPHMDEVTMYFPAHVVVMVETSIWRG